MCCNGCTYKLVIGSKLENVDGFNQCNLLSQLFALQITIHIYAKLNCYRHKVGTDVAKSCDILSLMVLFRTARPNQTSWALFNSRPTATINNSVYRQVVPPCSKFQGNDSISKARMIFLHMITHTHKSTSEQQVVVTAAVFHWRAQRNLLFGTNHIHPASFIAFGNSQTVTGPDLRRGRLYFGHLTKK